MTPLTCAEAEAQLEQFDDARPAAGSDLDRHLDTCAACRHLADDLAAIAAAAARLSVHPVPDAVWQRLRPRVATPLRGSTPAWSTPWLAAAAALLLAVGAALGTLLSGAGAGPAGEPTVAQVAAELEAAEAHYLRAIAGLERIARMDDPALDPAVAQVLRANLQEIDGAIRDTRAALAARPDDDVARRGLFDALGGKVALLEEAVSIIDTERTLDTTPPPGVRN